MVTKHISAPAQRWLNYQQPAYLRFQQSLQAPRATQLQKLKNYLKENASTTLGALHHFDKIKDYSDYVQQVPLQTYVTLSPYVADIAHGKTNVLTQEPVVSFETTSGTTSAAKLIPYTLQLKREFENAVAVWMTALAQTYPHALNGKLYWSLSPPLKAKRSTVSGIKVGLDSDLEYFSPEVASVIESMLAVSSPNIGSGSSADFFAETLLQLLMCEELSFISVWSPTFFLRLDEMLRELFPELLMRLRNRMPAQRWDRLNALNVDEFTWKSLFPNLSLLSAWADAQASLWLSKVRARLGEVLLQNKGLLSTEGIVSIPIEAGLPPVLAINAHFFEFKAMTSDEVLLCDQLEIGVQYEVIMTTAGGLYRYQTGDVIKVLDYYRPGVPAFEFQGRKDAISDCVGEKLSEMQVLEAFGYLQVKERTDDYQCLFLTVNECASSVQYSAYIETLRPFSIQRLHRMARILESVLSKNPYYQQALALGQLLPLMCVGVPPDFRCEIIERLKQTRNIKDGDLKLPILFPSKEWASIGRASCAV